MRSPYRYRVHRYVDPDTWIFCGVFASRAKAREYIKLNLPGIKLTRIDKVIVKECV